MKLRGFEIAKGWEDKDIHIPVRKTKGAAAYDVEAAMDIVIPAYKPGIKPTLIPTGLKAYCQEDEWYMLANRSSGPKKGFVMANSIGIVDSDYYENETNDGHIFVQCINMKKEEVKIRKGEKDEYDITGCRSERRCSIARGNKKDTRKNRKRIPWS